MQLILEVYANNQLNKVLCTYLFKLHNVMAGKGTGDLLVKWELVISGWDSNSPMSRIKLEMCAPIIGKGLQIVHYLYLLIVIPNPTKKMTIQ